ncbi:hypothetical protein N8607_01060 [bacterium]|nr:hypothetical protein [bacterium]
MKITIDASSALFGGAAALVLGLVSGFSPQSTPVPLARPVNPVSTMSMRPAARDIVWLEAQSGLTDPNTGFELPGTGFSSPVYTVPVGKILVVAGLSASNAGTASRFGAQQVSIYGAAIEIDGVVKRYSIGGSSSRNGGITFDVGIPLGAGQTVRVLEPQASTLIQTTSVNLHGYLEDA